MPTDLLKKIKLFQEKSNNFMDILSYFDSKINYLSYKLKYPEAYTDLIIYLYELTLQLEVKKFNHDEEILKYMRRCLNNKSINLYYKINSYKNFITYNSDEELLNVLDKNTNNDEYSNVVFKDLISSLKPKQKKIIFLKFYLQLSDVEIAERLKISRQAVNKSKRQALEFLKNILYREEIYV
ncbi:RNA polymerase subunit sigma-24 [Clostridium botulinum]|uniref:RNA polymerase sigma factor n=1 Tax=Clostridium botulinum TaxID=1491 RepID=UPI0005971334|nr:sigma-70 family RNA polymerase sigma factor [Clostridium botulinum]KIL09073.1 RNA polymerase subunit sigma-24 [Clostridium botulinum]MBY6932765.1 sigma-70 family RNA polymerase sigma factor [Clostridium botulinum]NFL86925.1 sigma-70 family RNA polymerase sigma factor [Clostridium botulinum]NFN10952.1 sigma-70 family RNA polymerase sigma factor [Clostridium botulinum]NFO22244.1 sigma-70 family RNA polymerase sigma factor [Clostridium botulinum]